MIPTKALSQRAYLRSIDLLDLPHESIEEYLHRVKHCRRSKLKAIRLARQLDESRREYFEEEV